MKIRASCKTPDGGKEWPPSQSTIAFFLGLWRVAILGDRLLEGCCKRRIISYFLFVFCSATPLWAATNANYFSADTIMRGLKSHSIVTTESELKARQQWMNDMWLMRFALTNEAERIQLTQELIQILNAGESSDEDKCAAAYLIGLFRLEEGIEALIKNFLLWNKAALEPDLVTAEGEKPAQDALIKISEQAIPKLMELIESNTDSYTLKYGAEVVLFIKGQGEGAEFLKQAIVDQADTNKAANLKAALASEYFTDPKYAASGPEKPRVILEARVTLKPEALEVSPGILTAFVRLPDGYPASGIASATCDRAHSERMTLNDDQTEMIIKFRRKDMEAALAKTGESLDTNFVVRGVWRGAAGVNVFQGAASITKIVGAKGAK